MNEEKGTCFKRTFEIMTALVGGENIISQYYEMMNINPESINIHQDIFLVHGHFKNSKGEEEPHAWIEIKDQFVYETQKEKEKENPIFGIAEYRDNMINPKRFDLIQTTILSHSEIANQVPWNTFDAATLASIQQKVSQMAQDQGILG